MQDPPSTDIEGSSQKPSYTDGEGQIWTVNDGSEDCLAIFLTEELIQESRAGGLRKPNLATTLTATSSRMAVVTTMATG